MANGNVPNNSSINGQVNVGARLVSLWAQDGTVIQVDEQSANYLVEHNGFARTPVDLVAQLKEIPALMEAAGKAMLAAIKAVQDDGELDSSDDKEFYTANLALQMVVNRWGEIQQSIYNLYSPKQRGNQVRMTHNVDGIGAVEELVDEKSVGDFKQMGWKEVK